MNDRTIELSIKVIVTKNIQKQEALNATRELVDAIIINTKGIKYHKSNEYKYYSFDGLPNIESKQYSIDEITNFRLRMKDPELANLVINKSKGTHTDKLLIIDIKAKEIKKNLIDSIYTLTPIVLKFDCGYWRGKVSIDEVEKRIKSNLVKKYNNYYNTKIDEDFDLFEGIEIKNKYPITIKYKDVILLGDKFHLKIASNEMAQELANFSISCGMSEMNARGLSFVRYNWI